MKTIEKPLMTEAEIHVCINMGWDEGAITSQERKLLSRVFTLNDKIVSEIMIPESQMKTLDLKAPLKVTENQRESELRRGAGEKLKEMTGDMGDLSDTSPERMANLIQELQVHQIELKMQNEPALIEVLGHGPMRVVPTYHNANLS